jgi:hypothetical protein
MTDYRTLDSEWNFALAYFKRLDEALRYGNLCKMQGNMSGWLEALLILHDELYPQMKPEEKEKLEELKNRAIKLVKQGGAADKFTFKGLLSNYDRELRVIMKERGMDMPRKSDPSRALLN